MNAYRAMLLSLVVGVVGFGLKWFAWRVTGSIALYSDALESIVNVAGALVAVVAVRIASEPPDGNHPWGHAKAEYLSAITEGALVSIAAVAILREAWARLHAPVPIESLGVGSIVSLVATSFNAALALYLRRVGQRVRSPAVIADSAHILSDVWTSSGILLGVGVTKLTGVWILDPLIAAALTVNLAWTGWKILRDSIAGLMDEAVPGDVFERISSTIARTLSASGRCAELRARRAGPRTFVELKLFVPGEMTVAASHEVCTRIEKAVEAEIPGASVVIHVEPLSLLPFAHA